jgi:transposase-like protein
MGRQRQGLRLPTARRGIAQQCPKRGKLHDDLRDAGETCSENRVARLASLAGIAAQIGYKRRPGRYAGKIIYTTNAIESLNRVIRKTTKTRGSFPTDDAATKLIYLAIRNFEKAGRCVRGWVDARNQFAILYPERFNK